MKLTKIECKIILELLSLASLDNENLEGCEDLNNLVKGDKSILKKLKKMAKDDGDEITTKHVEAYICDKLENS